MALRPPVPPLAEGSTPSLLAGSAVTAAGFAVRRCTLTGPPLGRERKEKKKEREKGICGGDTALVKQRMIIMRGVKINRWSKEVTVDCRFSFSDGLIPQDRVDKHCPSPERASGHKTGRHRSIEPFHLRACPAMTTLLQSPAVAGWPRSERRRVSRAPAAARPAPVRHSTCDEVLAHVLSVQS